MEQRAQYVLNQLKVMVPGRFDVEHATERTHPHIDWGAYRAVRGEAEALGFQHVADVDVVSVQPDPSIMRQPVLAVFIGPDGTEVLGHYRLSVRWTAKGVLARFMGARGNFFDVGTSFGGGAQGVELETSTASALGAWDQPDFYNIEVLPRRTSLEAVVQRHRERVRDYTAREPSAHADVVRTLDDIVALNRAMELRKLDWRRGRGWITREELARVCRLSGATLDRFHAAVQLAAVDTAQR